MKPKTYKGIGGTCGVMPYTMDGKNQGIFLSPEELFKSASKLINCPVVIKSHVPSDEVEKNKVGIVKFAYPMDDYSIGLDLEIWNKEAQDYIAAGNIELSAGYLASLSPEDSHWYGSPYSYKKEIQSFDHLAILPKGDARNRMSKLILNAANIENGIEENIIFDVFNDVNSSDSADINKMGKKIISIPETQVQFEVDPEVAKYIEFLNAKIQTLNDSNTSNTVQLNDSKVALENTIKQKEEELNAMMARLPKYLAIANKASKLGIAIDYEKFDPMFVMKQALASTYPGIEEQSEETVSFLFNSLKEEAKEATETQPINQTVSDSSKQESALKNQIDNVETKTSSKVSSEDMSALLAKKRASK